LLGQLLFTDFLISPALTYAQPPDPFVIGDFSSARAGGNLPDGWQPLTFSNIERHTDYSLVEDDGKVVVKAVSHQSASGLMHAISLDPEEYPVIQWRWKVENILKKGDVSRKDSDDYPARVYITFVFDPDKAGTFERLKYATARLIKGSDIPYRAIAYIRGSNSRAGTMVVNPYTDQVMMFVVEGEDEKLQHWVTERRNVYEDYRKAFGEEPTMISGVAIMTDTDNTRESAVAWYGDIVFMRGQGK